jgi:hypothetical protein
VYEASHGSSFTCHNSVLRLSRCHGISCPSSAKGDLGAEGQHYELCLFQRNLTPRYYGPVRKNSTSCSTYFENEAVTISGCILF